MFFKLSKVCFFSIYKQIIPGTVGRFCKLADGSSFTTSGDFWPNGATCGTECADGYLHRS